jgi:hypothetical protein
MHSTATNDTRTHRLSGERRIDLADVELVCVRHAQITTYTMHDNVRCDDMKQKTGTSCARLQHCAHTVDFGLPGRRDLRFDARESAKDTINTKHDGDTTNMHLFPIEFLPIYASKPNVLFDLNFPTYVRHHHAHVRPINIHSVNKHITRTQSFAQVSDSSTIKSAIKTNIHNKASLQADRVRYRQHKQQQNEISKILPVSFDPIRSSGSRVRNPLNNDYKTHTHVLFSDVHGETSSYLRFRRDV